MGYTTDFNGSLTLTPSATQVQIDYINKFSGTRRMKRNVDELIKIFKGKDGLPTLLTPTKEQQELLDTLAKSGLSVSINSIEDKRTPEEIYGNEGEFFVGDESTGVIDHNTPPGQVSHGGPDWKVTLEEQKRRVAAGECQPGLWCQWVLKNNGEELSWDGGEKFYNYVEWLQYMITKFFEPWGIKLNGEIEWFGEERSDIGKIVVTDNVVQVLEGKVTFY